MDIYSRLFHRDFSLVVIGQIISLFGNAILRFALPLALLDITGSAKIFGSVLAISLIPMILLSPLGGMIADRVNRKNIMVALDFFAAAAVMLFAISVTTHNVIVLIAVLMMVLSGIQACYQPAVQSSIPLLTSEANLIKANAIINQVNALSNLIGPILGGMLYGIWGVMPLITIGAVSFFVSAIMEIFIHIPFEKREQADSAFSMILGDLKESIHFVTKEKRVLLKIMVMIAGFNLFLTSMIIIGVPYLIKITLSLSSEQYGFTQGIMAAGALIGGVLVSMIGNWLKIEKSHWILLLATFSILPIGVVLIYPFDTMISYIVITLCSFLFMVMGTIFSIMMIALIQKETPNHLIGKVISYVLAITMCSQPIGQAMYGFLFGLFSTKLYVVVFATIIVSSFISLASKAVFLKLKIETLNK